MKMPVISSIVDKCPSITGTEEEKEAKLCAVVDYVDGVGGATLPEGVNALSEWIEIESCYCGRRYTERFERGAVARA